MADNILRAIIKVEAPDIEQTANQVKSSLQSITGGATILQTQLQRLEKIASLPGLNLNQVNRLANLINQTQAEMTKLDRAASAITPSFGKVVSSANELEKRIRIATSAEHEFNAILGVTPAILAGAENPARALGNEFLILSTGIQRAREAGQSFGSIFETLGASIFSLQGLITIAAGLLFSFSKELFNNKEASEANKEALDELAKSIEQVKNHTEDLIAAVQFANKLGAINIKVSGFGNIEDLAQQSIANQQLTVDLGKQKDEALKLADAARLAREQVEGIFKETASVVPGGGVRITKRKEDLEEAKRVELQAAKNLEDIQKKQADAENGQTIIFRQIAEARIQNERNSLKDEESLRTEEITRIKEFISRAKTLQKELGDAFIIPIDERFQSVFQEFSAHNLQLIKEKEDLEKRLKEIDIADALSGADQSKLKEKIQIQIFEIDKKLLQQDFESAIKFLHQLAATGFKVAVPVDIQFPKTIPEDKKAEFQKSINDLLQRTSASLKVVLNKQSFLEQTQSLQNIFDDLNKRVSESLTTALQKSLTVFENLNVNVSSKINVDEIINTLTTSLSGVKQAVDKATKGESFEQLLVSFEKIGEAGKQAGDLTRKAFLEAGFSVEEADKAAAQVEKSLRGISESAAEAGKVTAGILLPAFTELFSAIENGTNGMKAFFDSLIGSVKQLIAKLLAAAAVAAILNALTGGSIGFGKIFSSLLGFKEQGGPVEAGKPYVVGEKRPELFVPNQSGVIIPYVPSVRSESLKQSSDKKQSVYGYKIAQGQQISSISKYEYFKTDTDRQLKVVESIYGNFSGIIKNLSQVISKDNSKESSELIDKIVASVHAIHASDKSTESEKFYRSIEKSLSELTTDKSKGLYELINNSIKESGFSSKDIFKSEKFNVSEFTSAITTNNLKQLSELINSVFKISDTKVAESVLSNYQTFDNKSIEKNSFKETKYSEVFKDIVNSEQLKKSDFNFIRSIIEGARNNYESNKTGEQSFNESNFFSDLSRKINTSIASSSNISNSQTSNLTNISTSLNKFFSSVSYRASGGSVSHNRPFIVGEKEPELFIPRTNGFILPFVPKNILGFRGSGGPVIAGGSFVVGESGPEFFIPDAAQLKISTSSSGNVRPIQPIIIGGKLLADGRSLAVVLEQWNKLHNR